LGAAILAGRETQILRGRNQPWAMRISDLRAIKPSVQVSVGPVTACCL